MVTPHLFLPLLGPRQSLTYFLFLWICLFWIFDKNGIIQYMIAYDWLLLLSTRFSGFIHVVAVPVPHSFIAEPYSITRTYRILLIHSSADGHLGCFHCLAVVDSAAVNID